MIQSTESPTPHPNRKIFFDISSLIDWAKTINSFSGIQRVVAEVVSRFSDFYASDLIFVSWVDSKSSAYVCLPFSEIGPQTFESPLTIREFFYSIPAVDEVNYPLSRYSSKPIKHLYYRAKLDLAAAAGQGKALARFETTPSEWRQLRKNYRPGISLTSSGRKGKEVSSVASNGDRLVILDSSWGEGHTAAFRKAHNDGLSVYLLVHDLIPILFPETIEGPTSRIFAEWLVQSGDYTHTYLANSNATRQDLEKFLRGRRQGQPVKAVPLAQNIVFPKSRNGAATPNFPLDHSAYPFLYETIRLKGRIRNIAASDYVLCVGTIEARKNIWRIAAAWKRLLDHGHQDQLPKLVFAGRQGMLREDFEDLLRGTGNLYGWAHIVEGPTDAELDVLYRHCRFFIKASLYEGWGLPVGEGLSYGKTGVVSNAGSLPEVGGNLVEYCSPMSINSIADAVWRLISEPGRKEDLEAKVREATLRTWSDVTRDFARIIADT